MSYSEKLKDPRWQKKRLEILGRDNFTCKSCGSQENTLHVHHFTYQKGKEPWDYPDNNFITLCEFCHADEEQFIKGENHSFIKLSRVHFFSIARLFYWAKAITFLFYHDKKTFASIIKLINKSLIKNDDKYMDFCEKLD